MKELRIGRLIMGIDTNTYFYCLGAGKQNRGCKMKNSVDQIKLRKKHKEEKEKKDKKDKKDKGKNK